jgi:hypothetical protein
MDFLCPSCQKMLTVPDQYAGTLMKCPLCQNTFQAPALPAKPPPLSAAGPATPPTPPPPAPDFYGPKEPGAPPASAGTGPAGPALNRSVATAPAPSPPPTTGHQHERAIPLSPRVLPFIAPVCLALVFLLTFFPWVGYYWNGRGMLTQGAWGALTGFYGTPDLTEWQTVSGLTIKEAPPGMNLLLLPWLFLFLLALAASVASAVLPYAQVKLPPAVDQVKPYRWGAAAVLALLSLLVLLLVVAFGFSMEHSAWNAALNKVEAMKKDNPGSIHSDDEALLFQGREYKALGVQRTLWFRLVLFLLLLAVLGAGLSFWLDHRGSTQPVPQIALRW